ncbi:MAG: family 1 glycosylhydrolase [Limisphaerales bacterium]
MDQQRDNHRRSQAAVRASEYPELWGGIEATVNRVGDEYSDQLQLSAHYYRLDDIARIAATGIKALRYPILWEHHSGPEIDWSWADARMEAIRNHRIQPIVGLVHHGSGPRHTSLLESSFVDGLAAYARQVAERYPWVEMYTPVNEPLTTARFSCLYGHWYPHHKDALSFARALFIEIAATKAAMREIRKINPQAKLVQTEDMGKVYSTRLLAYQAEFENERRWLSLDLLCGRVDTKHPIWTYLKWIGVQEDELKPFLDDPCPPDIVGINHYVTSERFLDERLHRYPRNEHGGNHQHLYADVPAVRVCAHRTAGPYGVLKEAWERYKISTAMTECHLGCTREEQLRWLLEAWRGGRQLRKEGVDLRAITVWSLLGAYDWDSLLTEQRGHYESGAFDLRAPQPRPTAIVTCMQSLSQTGDFKHPVVATEGWWRSPIRLVYEPVRPHIQRNGKRGKLWRPRLNKKMARPILITGATGTLGKAFKAMCELRGLPYRIVTRAEMDICNAESIKRMVEEVNPWALINTAGYVRVDDAESDRDRCFRENTLGPAHLAQACDSLRIPFVTFSSDLVFDGNKRAPYVEEDPTAPMNVYGQSKAEAETKVLEVHPNALVVRTSAFFGPADDYNFITVTLRRLRQEEPVIAAYDAFISPTYVPSLVHSTLDLLIDGENGIWHLANKGVLTWAQLARYAASLGGVREDLIIEKSLAEMQLPAARPTYSVLGTQRGQLLGPIEEALCRYFEDRGESLNADAYEKALSSQYEADREAKESSEVHSNECIA